MISTEVLRPSSIDTVAVDEDLVSSNSSGGSCAYTNTDCQGWRYTSVYQMRSRRADQAGRELSLGSRGLACVVVVVVVIVVTVVKSSII